MLIKMKVTMTGTIDGKELPGVGGEVELADHVAQDMIANGYAEKVEKASKASKVETTSVDPVVETAAVKPAAKARKATASEK